MLPPVLAAESVAETLRRAGLRSRSGCAWAWAHQASLLTRLQVRSALRSIRRRLLHRRNGG